MTKEELLEEIAKRGPWYQSIHFPEFDVSTTDDYSNYFQDNAWDNLIGDITIEEATRLRPIPKWEVLKNHFPDVSGMDVLEIGSNCGFFSFKFSDLGAKTVTGLDVAPNWLSNANWCKEVLGKQNVDFVNEDFTTFKGGIGQASGLISDSETLVPLPNDQYDFIFMSTVLDHLFFPFFAIYKMIRMSKKWVVIDVPQMAKSSKGEKLMKMGIADDLSHHGFTFTKELLSAYFCRIGVPAEDIFVIEYNDAKNVIYKIDVEKCKKQLVGA